MLKLFLILPLLFFILTEFPESFAEIPEFLSVIEDQSGVSGTSGNSANVKLVNVHESSLSQDTMNITVFGQTILVTHEHTINIADNEFVYVGSTSDSANNVYIAYLDGHMRLELSSPSVAYILEPTGQDHTITKHDSLAFSPGGEGNTSVPVNPNYQRMIDDAPTGEISNDTHNDVIIDVIFLYTPNVDSGVGQGDIRMMGNLGIAKANNSFISSGIPLQLNRVGISGADRQYQESGSLETDLIRLATVGDGFLERGYAVRDNEEADIGLLFVDHSPSRECGRASMLPAAPDNAFAAINVNCGAPIGTVITHEIGHLLGGRHDVLTGGYHDDPPYAHGYLDLANNTSSVMAYPRGTDWRAEWSDPSKNFERTLIKSGTEHRENNALVVLKTGYQIASFRGGEQTYVLKDSSGPVISITSPSPQQTIDSSTVQVMGTITENQSTITEVSIAIDSGSAITLSTSERFSHTFSNLSEGQHTVTVTATNSVDLTSEQTVSFTVNTLDRISPIITVPIDRIFEATSTSTPISNLQLGTATATDNEDPDPTISNDAPAQFQLGITTVTWTARDGAGNTATDTQTITIQDTTSPIFDSYGDITSDDAIVEFDLPTARDIFPVTVTCDSDSGDTFQIGTTRVTCTATDTSGNSDTTSFNVIVRSAPQDTTPPQFTNNPENITVGTTGQGRIVQFDLPPATDDSGSVTVVCNPASGSTFLLGTTSVTCTATDPSNNSDSVSFDVIVQDTAPPQFTNIPENVTVSTSGQPSIAQFDLPVATDNSGTVNVVCDPTSGTIFQIGTTIVTCTATDPTGNFTTTSFDVIVQSTDATPPQFTDMPRDIRIAITGTFTQVDFNLPVATDNSGSVTVVCNPASGSTFRLGTTTVTCTATDPSGNSTTTSFNVTVQDTPLDTTDPRFTDTPENIKLGTTSESARVFFSLPTATDDSGTVTVVCDPAPGSTFRLGTTTITCTATDPSNNSVSVSFDMIIVEGDSTPPRFTDMPRDITRATTTSSAIVRFDLPPATDNSGSVSVSCTPASGSSFPIGTTTVTCTAIDPQANTDTVSFDVIVRDNTSPQFPHPPEDLTLEITVPSLRIMFGIPPATDNSGSVDVVCDPAPGSTLRLGTTTITCTATDPSGNSTTTSFDIILLPTDTTPPQFTDTLENITVETATNSAIVQFDLPAATDNSGTVNVMCDPASGSTFQIGTTTITCTATDPSNNSATTSFDVMVLDTTMPQFTAIPENITVNTTAQSIIVQFDLPAATDNSGPVDVTCDPESGSTFQFGTTTVTCTATDDSNNSNTTSFDVIVRAPPDVTPPQFTDTLDDIIINASGQSHMVEFDLPAATDDSGSVTVVCDPASGSIFQLGTTTITCTATDPSDNSNTTSFDVLVRAPTPILNFQLIPTGTTIHVDWISSSATGFKAIIYPTSDGFSSRTVGTTSETHFTFINLEPETEYTVEVQARMHPQTRTMLSTTTLEAPEEPELQFTPSIVSDQILIDITNNLNLVVDYKYFAEYSTNGTSFTPIIGSLGSPRHVAIVEDMIGTDVHLRIYQNIGGQKLYSDTVILTIPSLVPPANFAISQNADTLELSWDPTLARKYIIRGDGFSEPVPYGTNNLSIPITDDMLGTTITYTIQSEYRDLRSTASSVSVVIPDTPSFEDITDDFADSDSWTFTTFHDGFVSGYQGFTNYLFTTSSATGNPAPSGLISGDGFVSTSTVSRDIDITDLGDDSLYLGIDYRVRSGSSHSVVTNITVEVLDDSDNIIYSNRPVGGGIRDTGWRSFDVDITRQVANTDSITVSFHSHDSWIANWNQKVNLDNFYLGTTNPVSGGPSGASYIQITPPDSLPPEQTILNGTTTPDG